MIPAASVRGRPGRPEDELAESWPRALERARRRELPLPAGGGQLIRPLLGLAGTESPDDALWDALLAVQLAHEASLLHDDVIDGAARRRGQPTAVAARGVAAALVEGDHLLTAGYRLAAETGSLAFTRLYARAVERTVAGERRQNEGRGRRLTLAEYDEIALGKSGELIGCAVAAGAVIAGDPTASDRFELGRRIGLCYQMLDDLLDYCAASGAGKEPFSDFQRRLWTWPLRFFPDGTWPADRAALDRVLREPDRAGATPLERAREELDRVIHAVRCEVAGTLERPHPVEALLDDWRDRARRAVGASLGPDAIHVELPSLPDRERLRTFFARNSRTFSFAARLLPRRDRDAVADLYGFCRVTDDLVDGVLSTPAEAERRLDAWLAVCRRGYDGEPTGLPTLDRLLATAADRGVAFDHVELLVRGMRMDVRPRRYESLADLRLYTHAVAGVVGLWLARLWGVRDERVLRAAAELGHAMQLTNIVRDVGEDLRLGRIYLPTDLMRRFGLDEAALRAMAGGAPLASGYRALLEALMGEADAAYDRALEGVDGLPPRVRPAVIAAAAAYRGIHAAVRANGHDTIHRRARTTRLRKLALAARALARLGPGRRPIRPLLQGAALPVVVMIACWPLAAGAQPLGPPDAPAAALSPENGAPLASVRALWLAGLGEPDAVDRLDEALGPLRAAPEARDAAVLEAYHGALLLLRAKHGSWPPSRWRDARAGIAALDRAVAWAPEDPEVRYLRLVNALNLPSLFGRRETARSDLDVLAQLFASGRRPPEPILGAAERLLLDPSGSGP